MNYEGYRQVLLKSIHVDAADIRKRMKAPHVIELANDIKERGNEPIHAPTIRAKSKAIVCGRDRFAAALILGLKRLWVHVVECTDEDATMLEVAENAHRRPENRTALIARIAELRESYWSNTMPDASIKEVRALANTDAARMTGVGVQRVKDAKVQARAAKSSADGPPSHPASAQSATAEEPAFIPTLNLLGVPIEEVRQLCELAASRQAAIDEADKYLRLAQAALKRVEQDTQMQQLYADVHRVASRVRSCRPESICPWCKGVPALVATCSGCQMTGYVSEEQGRNCPPELLGDADPVVVVNGQLVPYTDALAKGRAA